MNTITASGKTKGKAMENCVKWSQFVVTLIAVVGILTATFAYIFTMHNQRPHTQAATQTQIQSIHRDISKIAEQSTKTREDVAALKVQIDNVNNGIEEVKRLVR